MKGIEITEKLLLELGCEVREYNKRKEYQLISFGYEIIFEKFNNTEHYEVKFNRTSSRVTHLDEVFGVMVSAGITTGRDQKLKEINDVLKF